MSDLLISEADKQFCKQHLHKWCRREGKSEAQEQKIWNHFLTRPGYYLRENWGWTNIAHRAGV